MNETKKKYEENFATVIEIVNRNYRLPKIALASLLNAGGFTTKTGKQWTSSNVSGFMKDNHCRTDRESRSLNIKDKDMIDKIIVNNWHKTDPEIAKILNSFNLKTINGLDWSKSTVYHYGIRYLELKPRSILKNNGPEVEQENETIPKYAITELVFEKEGKFFTDSLMIASIFERKHFNILELIKNLDCSKEFRYLNFQVSSYTNLQNKEFIKFVLTRDGFSMIAMGLTGSKAVQFKEMYINQFNQMEEALKNQQTKEQIKPPTYSEALRLLADNLEKTQLLEAENKKQSDEIKELIPQSLLLNVFTATSELKTLRQIGYKLKQYDLGPNKIFKFLRKHGVLVVSNGENYPTHAYRNLIKIETIVKRWVDKNTGEEKSKAFDILKAHTGFYKILAGLLVNDKILTINQFNMIDFNNVPKDDQIYDFVEKVS